jgi:D-alanine-D-alanine ligase
VLVLHTLPPDATAKGRSRDEFDLSEAASAVAAVLPEARMAGVHGDAREILALLEKEKPDVVFNACEAPLGRPDLEAHLAALLEWSGVRFTGCGSETLALCRRKDRAGALLAAAGVAVPREGAFPCIVKPAAEDGSAGITARSMCRNEQEVARARARWDGPVIVQEFLPGREFAVSLWGAREPEHSSIGEFCFRGGLALNTYASKWDTESEDFANSPLFYDSEIAEPLRTEVLRQALGAWRAVEARGYLRVDLRLDAGGQPRVLDVNPNPELAPGVGIHRAVTEAGWTWERFVRQQVLWA